MALFPPAASAASTVNPTPPCALNLTRRATERELSFAIDLQQRLPRVWLTLSEGDIDVRRAKVIADRTSHLSIAGAHEIVDRIIDHAPRLTTGQLRARIDRMCLEADVDTARDRYRHAVKDRRVVTEATTDGTANFLGLSTPPHRVAAASRRVDRLAKSLKTKGDNLSMDQLRADVYLDLLQGKQTPGRAAGSIHLKVDLDTLTALSEHPGELMGYGPVIADIARQVTEEQADAEWRFDVTDTTTGQTISSGITRRRPSTALHRSVEIHNPTCIFPGCRMPSVDCDIDHSTRWADGGATEARNLAPVVPSQPHRQGQIRLDLPAASQRRLPVDQPPRPHLHHQRLPAVVVAGSGTFTPQ